MARFNLDQYETVEDRLRKFYEKYPDGRVITELVAHTDKQFIFKASIYRDHNPDTMPWATGYAEEIVGSTPVNKTSAAENCETSSVGRALANANFAPKGARPSREEMEKVQRREAKPKPVSKPVDVDVVSGLINSAGMCGDVDSLKALWNDNKEVLDAVVDGMTLRDAILARRSELEASA